MIKEIIGDLIEQANEFDVIAHGANCFLTMGARIALQIKYKFPEAYMADIQTQYGDKNKLGTISYTENTEPTIVNYDALRNCMKELKNKFSGKKIGMPMIGCGLAGGDWNIIKKIIEEELSDEDVTIVKWNR